MAWYLIKLYYIHESAIQRPNMNTKTNTDKVPTTHLYLVSRQVSSFSIWPVRMSQLRYPWYVRNPNTSRFSKYLKLQHKGVVDNNNNSDIALYPVKIYELAVLYIINTVHYQHRHPLDSQNSTSTMHAYININMTRSQDETWQCLQTEFARSSGFMNEEEIALHSQNISRTTTDISYSRISRVAVHYFVCCTRFICTR